eukprot:sb/3479769/
MVKNQLRRIWSCLVTGVMFLLRPFIDCRRSNLRSAYGGRFLVTTEPSVVVEGVRLESRSSNEYHPRVGPVITSSARLQSYSEPRPGTPESGAEAEVDGALEECSAELLQELRTKQEQLRKQVIFGRDLESTFSTVGGFDISFGEGRNAAAALVVIKYPSNEVVYESVINVTLEMPYVSGFLGFREIPALEQLLEKMKNEVQWQPDVIMVDGNGRLNQKQMGLKCLMGVVTGIRCFGVAKDLIQFETISRDNIKDELKTLESSGDWFPLKLNGVVLGCAVKTGKDAKNPIYVSEGHGVTLETAREIVMATAQEFRVPVPERLRDTLERKKIREYKEKRNGQVQRNGTTNKERQKRNGTPNKGNGKSNGNLSNGGTTNGKSNGEVKQKGRGRGSQRG